MGQAIEPIAVFRSLTGRTVCARTVPFHRLLNLMSAKGSFIELSGLYGRHVQYNMDPQLQQCVLTVVLFTAQNKVVLYILTPADSKLVYSRRIFIVMDIISSNFVVEGYFVVIGGMQFVRYAI